MKYFSLFLWVFSLICLPCMSETISEDKALSVAQQFMNANRLRHRALVRWNGIRKNTNYEKSQSQDPYYIFTSSDSMGFVIVAGDDLARPILAYSKDARLGDRDNLPPGMQDWLNGIRRQISAAKETPSSAANWQASDTIQPIPLSLVVPSWPP